MTDQPRAKPTQHATQYRLRTGLSTRAQPDPACSEWLHFEAGTTYAAADFPAHVQPRAYVAAGVLEEVSPQ